MMTRQTRLRQQKRSPEEIRMLLVDAGEQIIVSRDARGIVASLTLTAVFEKIQREQGIRLTNASVLGRAFESVEEYRRAVLLRVASGESEDFSDTSNHVFQTVILNADLSRPESRWTALQETCRVGANFMVEALKNSPTWRLWLGILAYAVADPDANKDLIAALELSYQRLDQQSLETYAAALAILGFRVKENASLDHFSFWADTMAEGVGIRSLVEPGSSKTLMLATGPERQPQKWTMFALALWALAQEIIELDPQWVATA